jgi:hypothetical protein
MIDRIAMGHSADRNTVAAVDGEVRGRKALSKESGTATSAPYNGVVGRQV